MSKLLEEGKTDYLEIKEKIDVLTAALQYSVEDLRNKIVPAMESDFKADNFDTPPELLREYIQITRDIRSLMFKRIDTHILTIEHLADKMLCRRASLERNRRVAVKRAAINAHEDTKVASSILDSMKHMTQEERQKFADMLRGTQPIENKGDSVLDSEG